ncbi:Astakine [Dufourea novaeangliae]|uniref:Astakine n=1 Tax=Dufourea novaeangliae TaxID=178035 RepID=A0A154P459_DUFNO|nr:Astakine [Dufourea novaeangliae]
MTTPILLVSILLFTSRCILGSAEDRPEYIHCQSNLECGPGHCCSIGPIRYSIPQCRPMQAEGEICRPASEFPINMTAAYPDGAQVLLTDVHYILCPCANGLSCDKGVCKDTGEKRDLNRLIGENNHQDD